MSIASRLAEFASVAVVEAGGFYEVENGNNSVVPFLGLVMPVLATTEVFPKQPLVDWGLVSEVQTGASNRRIHYAQGKTLGGSSALNTMAYLRGTKGSCMDIYLESFFSYLSSVCNNLQKKGNWQSIVLPEVSLVMCLSA